MKNRQRELEQRWESLNRKDKKKWTKNLAPPVVIKRGTSNPIIHSDRKKKLDVVIISVNYNDFLTVSLKHNIEIFDNITVVTSESDILCQKICEKFEVKCITTNVMYEEGSEFNKGKAINEGIRSIENPDFILLLDADIIVKGRIDLDQLDEDSLYTSSRYICKSYNQLSDVLNSDRIPDDSATHEGDKGIGFFQLFNINNHSIDRKKVYPETSTDASWDDLVFRDKFPKRSIINNQVVHLGDPYINWKGRKSNRFLTDEEIISILSEEIRFNINKYFGEIYCLNLDRRKDRWIKVSKKFSKLSIRVKRWTAIDGDTIDYFTDSKDEKTLSIKGEIENKYALACLMSHIDIIKDAKLKNHKKILIFEDDVIFSKDFLNEIKILKSKDWKLFYLGASQFMWKDIQIDEGIYKCNNTLGTFAYAIDYTIFDELIDILEQKKKSIDNYLSVIQDRYPNQCFTFYPNIVISNVEDSDIRKTSDITEYAKLMRWPLDKFEETIRVLLVPDVEGWAFDNIAKSIVKYNPNPGKIEYDIVYVRDIHNGLNIDYDDYDYIYVMFEAERIIPDSKKVIRGCYSAFWLENKSFTPEKIADFMSNCAGAIFANEFLKNSVERFLPNDFSISVIPDSSDESIFYPITNQKNDKFTAIFVGNTKRKVKNFDTIKWICNESDIELIVCSDVKNSELVNYYNKADICINFSDFEGGPQTFIESSLCEVPMLIRNNNELSKSIPCFTAETKEDFVEIIKYLKKNRQKCVEVGKKAKKVALKEFTYKKTAEKFYNFFLNINDDLYKSNKKDLTKTLTVFVISCGQNPNYQDCLEALKNQTVKFQTKEIKNVSPMSKAFQCMIDECTTEYYIQVDEDMILNGDSIEKIYESLKYSKENISTVAFRLKDTHLDFNLYGIKGYKHSIMKKYPYNLKIISCEVEQMKRLQNDGYETLVNADVVGFHSPKWTNELIYERYFDLMEKWKVYKYDWLGELPSKIFQIFQQEPTELNFCALMGVMTSLNSEEKLRKGEKNFSIKDKNFERLSSIFLENGDFKFIKTDNNRGSQILDKNYVSR